MPTSARSDGGSSGFSTRRSTSPASLTAATPNCVGSSTWASEDLRGRRVVAVARARRLELVDELGEPLLQHVVAEVHHEVVVAEEVRAIRTQWARPSGASCGM